MSRRALIAMAATLLAAACSTAALGPAELDTRTDTCAVCRMLVSDRPLASQIVAPREDPMFFDHPRCLADYLTRHPSLPPGAVVYTGTRAGGWTPTDRSAALEDGRSAGRMGGTR